VHNAPALIGAEARYHRRETQIETVGRRFCGGVDMHGGGGHCAGSGGMMAGGYNGVGCQADGYFPVWYES